VAQPTTQLNATEQDTLVKQIGLALLRAAPRDWRRVSAEYRAVGRYHELTGEIENSDGSTQEWVATHDIATLFGRLRAGMYRDGRGTWFNARYQLDHPSSYNLEYNRDEPRWDLMPPPQAYADELRMFPRSEDNVPEWLMRRLAGLGPEQPGPHLRIARIFDGAGPNGRPVINRPDLEVDEQDHLLDYLDQAPVVLNDRGLDVDRLAPTPENTVPVAFHSDGVWIWPAAVNFYLREYGVSPEPDLVQHIRSSNFTLGEVSDQQRQAAAGYLTRGNQQARPDQQVPARPVGPPVQTTIPVSLPEEHSPVEPPFDNDYEASSEGNGRPYTSDYQAHGFHEPEPDAEEEPAAHEDLYARHPEDQHMEPEVEEPAAHGAETGPQATTYVPSPIIDPGPVTMLTPQLPVLDPQRQAPPRHEPAPPPVPPAPSFTPVSHAQAPAAEPEEQDTARDEALPALELLQNKLDELGVPADAYRIGGPVERGWSVEKVDEGWRVGWYDGELTDPAVFGDADDAAAFMLGKLLLGASGTVPEPAAVEAPAAPPPLPRREGPPSVTTVPAELATGAHRPEPREQEDEDEGGPPTQAMPSIPAGSDGPEQPGEPAVALPQTPPEEANGQRPLPTRVRREVPPPPPPPAAPVPPPAGVPGGGQPLGGPGGPGGPGAGGPGAGAPVPPSLPRRAPERPPAAPAAPGGQQQQQWPIKPLTGEPPLTLFRGKEMRELPAGSELDRFGGPSGNLTYAAGTPFEERSLVPEWVSRPYHVYRVQRPIEALAGVAIPWFNQPGGGAAYLLPASIEQLVAEGDLLELEPGEPPID
jgi:hypothetical protein